MPLKLLFLTGTRADFGKLLPLSEAALKAGHNISFFVTGMHMLSEYGSTYNEVRRVKGAEVHEYINQRIGDSYDFILTKTVLGVSDWLHEHKPDLVIVHGDRIEALATALTCATNYIRCAHIEGGEVSGTIDEVYRHSVTKLAHYHFVCSEKARDRVKSLGEEENRIFMIGSPELDLHASDLGVSIDEVRKHYEIPYKEYGIVTMHSVTSETDTIRAQAENFFDALDASGKDFVVISPNNDPGSEFIRDVIETMPKDRFRHIPSMRFSYFSVLLRNASAMLGNSSAGVREAPFFGVPSLNIGSRQTGRATAKSITHSDSLDTDGISTFLKDEWGKPYPTETEFGDGSAAHAFVEAISSDAFWNVKLQKYFVDH